MRRRRIDRRREARGRRPRRWAASAAAVALAASCTGGDAGGRSTVEPTPVAQLVEPAPSPVGGLIEPQVYVAVGASESVGAGTHNPFRDAWPKVLWRTSLPEGSVYYGLGVSGSTVEQALHEQLPAALEVEPTIATVWLNVNDLNARVPPATYEARLRELVRALRRGGRTTVAVANIPRLAGLPVYRMCLDASEIVRRTCEAFGIEISTQEELRRLVDAYNEAIARVVTEEGAVLVDLHAQGDVAETDPELVAADGFHPSTEGAEVTAELFAAALDRGLG